MSTDYCRFIEGSIDTHAHLTLATEKGVDVPAILTRAMAERMAAVIDVGIAPEDLAHRVLTLRSFPLVAFTSGLHPTAVTTEGWRPALELLALQCRAQPSGPGEPTEGLRIVAIGETGLDFYRSADLKTSQIDAFVAQLELATTHSLPVVIHNRSSDREMLDVLSSVRPNGVMHCFSQDVTFCRRCLDLGLSISFGGNVTYKGSDAIRDAARLVPDDRILVETDAPFLSPQKTRGRANHPGYLGWTIEELAALRQTTPERLAITTAANARHLFGLPVRPTAHQ